MLRRWVIAAGVAALVLAATLAATGHRAGVLWPLAIWGALAAGGLMIERTRYKAELEAPPGTGWVATAERTVDAAGVVTVWFNPATGERAYVRTLDRKEDVLF